MNESLSAQLLEESICMAIEEKATSTSLAFTEYVQELLPPEVLLVLEDIHGDTSFLVEIWKGRFR